MRNINIYSNTPENTFNTIQKLLQFYNLQETNSLLDDQIIAKNLKKLLINDSLLENPDSINKFF